jgi:hypothetical protein
LSPEAVLETMQNALPNGRIGLALIVMDEKQGGLWFPELERCRVDQAAKRSDKAPLLRRPSQRLGNLASASDLRRRHGPECYRVKAVGTARAPNSLSRRLSLRRYKPPRSEQPLVQPLEQRPGQALVAAGLDLAGVALGQGERHGGALSPSRGNGPRGARRGKGAPPYAYPYAYP